jgi:hypothetical protein
VVLYSHGFGPLTAADAPSPGSGAQLLAQGYALVGSSYDVNGSWWALDTAVSDQFGSLTAFLAASGLHPQRTLAVGTSMGGLINSLIDQESYGRVQGAVTFCGLVAGGVDLNNYQLNAEYAMTELLPGAAGVQIRDFASMAAGTNAGTELGTAVASAQSTASGRARIALSAALLNETDWTTGAAPPAAGDYAGQELQEEEMLTSGQLPFIESGRYMISLAEGGDSGYNIGVNYGALIRQSPYYRQIKALYKAAGLNLRGAGRAGGQLAAAAAGLRQRHRPLQLHRRRHGGRHRRHEQRRRQAPLDPRRHRHRSQQRRQRPRPRARRRQLHHRPPPPAGRAERPGPLAAPADPRPARLPAREAAGRERAGRHEVTRAFRKIHSHLTLNARVAPPGRSGCGMPTRCALHGISPAPGKAITTMTSPSSSRAAPASVTRVTVPATAVVMEASA